MHRKITTRVSNFKLTFASGGRWSTVTATQQAGHTQVQQAQKLTRNSGPQGSRKAQRPNKNEKQTENWGAFAGRAARFRFSDPARGSEALKPESQNPCPCAH